MQVEGPQEIIDDINQNSSYGESYNEKIKYNGYYDQFTNFSRITGGYEMIDNLGTKLEGVKISKSIVPNKQINVEKDKNDDLLKEYLIHNINQTYDDNSEIKGGIPINYNHSLRAGLNGLDKNSIQMTEESDYKINYRVNPYEFNKIDVVLEKENEPIYFYEFLGDNIKNNSNKSRFGEHHKTNDKKLQMTRENIDILNDKKPTKIDKSWFSKNS